MLNILDTRLANQAAANGVEAWPRSSAEVESKRWRNHGLYGSTSCCISQCQCQWEMANFDPPQPRNRLTDEGEIRTLELSPEDHPPSKISFRFDDVGGLGEYRVCHCPVFSLSFFFTARRNARIVSAVLATAIPSVCPSAIRRYCVKTTARSTVQFALSDSKMCLVL